MIILENELPKLTGSEKQIKIATAIRKNIIEKWQDKLDADKLTTTEKQWNTKVLASMQNHIMQETSSNYWFDNQNFSQYYKQLLDNEINKAKLIQKLTNTTAVKTADIYINGSYDDMKKIGGYGIVLIADETIEEISEIITNPEQLAGFNISVKMAAAIRTMNKCMENKITNINLHHDLAIFETLIREQSNPKTPMTILYKKTYWKLKDKLQINFKKVDNDNKYLTLAGKLARQAINKFDL